MICSPDPMPVRLAQQAVYMLPTWEVVDYKKVHDVVPQMLNLNPEAYRWQL